MTGDPLTPTQELALVALLNEPTIAAAAVTAGVSESTLYRWLREPAFAAEYQRARREAVRQAVAQVQRVSWAAVSVLMQLMVDKTAAPSVRLNAASKILDLAIRAVELEDMEARIAALEARY